MCDSLAFSWNKWPPNFKADPANRMVFIYGTCQFSPEWKNLRDDVHHYSNQGESTHQTRNRRHEQIENVLFESDPICTAIYLKSEGTVRESRKACKLMEKQWIKWKNKDPEPKPEKENTRPQLWRSDLQLLWSTAFEHKKLRLLMAWFSTPSPRSAIIYNTQRG